MARCATTAFAGAVPRLCVRGARGRFGGIGPVPGVVSLPLPPSRPACPALRVAGRPVRVSPTLARRYAIPRGLCVRVLGPVALLVVLACPLRVCALALPRRPLPPPLGGVACAPRAVPALGAGRAVPRGPCPSACPAPVPCPVCRAWGGAVRSRFPPTWLLFRGASEVRRSSSPDCPPTGRAVGVRYPRAVGAGVWAWGPNTVPLACMPCRGCVPRGWCGGGAAPGGGWPATVVGGIWCQALSLPRPPVLWAGCRGPLPTGCGCGGVRAWGPITNPTEHALASLLCAPWGRHEGSWGGAPPAWAWGVWGRALSHPRVPALWAGCRGPRPTRCRCGGVRAWGPVTNPTARSCVLWGRHEGARGGRSLPWCGASGVARSPTPGCPPSGRAAGAHYPLASGAGGCGRGDPSPTPQRALFRAGFAHCGGGMRAPGGGRLLPGCGASGVRRSPTPDCPPSGRAAGAHYPLAVGAGGCGRGDPSPTPQRALFRAGFARCGGGTRAPGGGRLLSGCGTSGVGRSPTHDCPPSGQAAGAHYPLAVGAGGCGRWDP